MHNMGQIQPKAKGFCLRGHDQSDPENVTISPSGKRRCKPCRRLLDKQHRLEKNPLSNPDKLYVKCHACGKDYRIATGWKYCGAECAKTESNRKGLVAQLKNPDVNALAGTEILALYDRLDRASTSWERADIRKLIQDKLCSQRRNSESS
jgi:RNase P subunit RPR2